MVAQEVPHQWWAQPMIGWVQARPGPPIATPLSPATVSAVRMETKCTRGCPRVM